MPLLAAGIAALLMATSAAHAADWEYDYWRCAAGHKAGNFYIRISSSTEPIEFDIRAPRTMFDFDA
jgi:hypothetical protein